MASVKRSAAVSVTPPSSAPATPGRKRKPYDYAQYKKAFRNPADFAFFLSGYPDMSGVLAYWYRLHPKIDLSRIGQDATNLMTTIRPDQMTETFAAETWGSGKYMLKFTDANRRSDQQEAARAWFDVDDPALPAKYDPRCLLLNHPQNADEVERLLAAGVLVRDGEYGSPRLKTEANAGPLVSVAPVAAAPPQTFGSLGDQLIVKLLDRALPSATPPTASEYLKQSFDIADRFRVIDAPPQPSIEQIAEAVARKLQPATAAPAPPTFTSELEVYERVGVLLDKVGAGRALGAVDPSIVPGWAAFLGPIIENTIKPLIPVLTGYLMRGMGPAPAAPPGPRPLTIVASNETPAAPAPGPGPLVLLPATAPLMDRARQVAELGIRKCNDGIEGARYAAWVYGFYPGGVEVWDLFAQAGGTQGALGFMAMDPVLGAMLRDPAATAQVSDWLDDFFSFSPGGDGDEEDEEDEQPVEAAVAAATA